MTGWYTRCVQCRVLAGFERMCPVKHIYPAPCSLCLYIIGYGVYACLFVCMHIHCGDHSVHAFVCRHLNCTAPAELISETRRPSRRTIRISSVVGKDICLRSPVRTLPAAKTHPLKHAAREDVPFVCVCVRARARARVCGVFQTRAACLKQKRTIRLCVRARGLRVHVCVCACAGLCGAAKVPPARCYAGGVAGGGGRQPVPPPAGGGAHASAYAHSRARDHVPTRPRSRRDTHT